MTSAPVVLIFGDTNGQFKHVFNKIRTVVGKLNNAAMAFCVGNFFNPNCDEEWNLILKGELVAPIQIYILGPSSNETKRFYPESGEMTDLVQNITYLGKRGCFTSAEGLKVVYVSGIFGRTISSGISYTYDDLRQVIKEVNGRIDLLLTWGWPNKFGLASETNINEGTRDMSCSFLFSKLAPQYHVSGREKEPLEVLVQRQYDDGTSAGSSRFIGLPHLGGEWDLKWMRALSITPYIYNDNSNDKPLSSIIPLEITGLAEFTKNLEREADIKSTKRHMSVERREQKKAQKSDWTDQSCWFCLSSSKTEKHLIISIGTYSFVALAKGPIVDDHVLITTINHRSSMRVLGEDERNEITKYKRSLRISCEPTHVPVFYERTYRTIHMQVHSVPVPASKFKLVPEAFKTLSEKYNLHMKEYFGEENSYLKLSVDDAYFHVDLGEGHELLITGSTESFPLNFGREALVADNVLNLPWKKNWQKCQQTTEEETVLVNSFKVAFKDIDLN